VILAWLVAEDDGARKRIVALLADRDEDLSLIQGTLKGMFQQLQVASGIYANYLQSKSRVCQKKSQAKRIIRKCWKHYSNFFERYRYLDQKL
jgi:hypothetical protein